MSVDQPAARGITLDGSVAARDEKTISLELYPGAVIDVELKDLLSLEEGTDPISGRSFVRITLDPDAELHGTFTPRLLKLALSKDPRRTPFSLGGNDRPDVDTSDLFPSVVAIGPGGPVGDGPTGGGPWGGTGRETIGDFRTKSMDPIWGFINDDMIHHDERGQVVV